MTEYPKDAQFIYSWRKYQQRVLDDLDSHLNNRHLHVIAPPGSGKTILGLEVARRINKPTLILAPTLAIRNQWIQRFCELFLQTSIVPEWISRDIKNPKFLTVVTYQGLHAACNNLVSEENVNEMEEEVEESETVDIKNNSLDKIANGLLLQNIKTIVVDEAHHLKNEWWQSLIRIKEKLDPIIVGLTATPPYDVTGIEWQRYIDLNGPVDTEISVPELVIEEDLCPHQDYIYFTWPSPEEHKTIVDFRENMELLFNEIKSDQEIVKAIQEHPIWQNPVENLDWIYNNISYYSACIIFLNANKIAIPVTHIEVIGDKAFSIPLLDYEWIENLVDFYLYNNQGHFAKFEEHQKSLENRLRRYGAIEKKKINFSHNKRVSGILTSSISKLNGIKEIVDFEYQHLGQDLRLVILSDYIRKEFFVNETENYHELNKIGVVPIFETLRRDNTNNKKLAVLTGSLVIIPTKAIYLFESLAKEYSNTYIESTPVSYDANYLFIQLNEQIKHNIVHIVTQIFQLGEIEILIGTKSLLGEGWDAPAINSLILASFVGSFVLSNQMRGRAIRTERGNKNKTGNIWHLACVDSTTTSGGDDVDLLKRRFRSFVGVSFKEGGGIENGIDRLDLPVNMGSKQEIALKNKETLMYAADRASLQERWRSALLKGIQLIEELKIPFLDEREYKSVKSLYYNKTIANLFATLSSGVVTYTMSMLQAVGRNARVIRSLNDLYMVLALFGAIGIGIFGRLAYKSFKLFVTYRDISKDIERICDALLLSLIKSGAIHTTYSELKVEANVDSEGSVYCHLEGGTTYEKSVFINALQEIVGPVNNPRYIILRKSKFFFFIRQKDYHSVPELLGKNKSSAEYFASKWEKFVGNCELIFTRSIEGRQLILKSRMKSLASQFEEKVEHVNKWR